MAFKDILADLQEGIEQTKQRRALNEEVLSGYSAPPAQAPVGNEPTGSKPGRGGGAGNPGGPIKGGPRLKAFLQAVAQQESGGNYGAVGVPTKYGTAQGKYQILDSNIEGKGRGWDQEVLGRDITVQKFLNTPRLQEKIARGKLRNYFKQYGPSGAAKAWYAGPGNANTNSDSSQYGGPSINDYAAQVLEKMRGNL